MARAEQRGPHGQRDGAEPDDVGNGQIARDGDEVVLGEAVGEVGHGAGEGCSASGAMAAVEVLELSFFVVHLLACEPA